MCTQENTSVILPSSSNFRVLKFFHNGPIDTTGILSWNVPDETLYTVQSNFLGFLTSYIVCKVSPKALKLNLKKFYSSVILCKVSSGVGAESSEVGLRN